MRTVYFEHVIVHQFDPAENIAGGVHGFIRDFIRFAPEHHRFRLVGVDGSGRWRPWVWQGAEVEGRTVPFLPLARLSAGRQQRLLPHTLRLIGGLLARRPRAHGALLHAHRAETLAVLASVYPRSSLIQFIHTDSAEGLRHRTETFWRFLPKTHLEIERFAVRRAARTWVFNAAAARRLASASPNVQAGRNWYDDTLFHPAATLDDESRPLTVGWVGRMEAPKDPLKAVEVLAELARAGVPFRAWFAGSGTLEERAERLVAERHLTGSVTFRGVLSPPNLAEELRHSDVLLVSSLWEGQPRAVLEALGCGIPVVATDVGDVPEIVREGQSGYVARAGTSGQLAELVRQAGALRDRRAIAATVESFRASEVVGAYFDELEFLIRQGQSRRG
jgi:glycosyltransferase involved in cell wall biosynthesis